MIDFIEELTYQVWPKSLNFFIQKPLKFLSSSKFDRTIDISFLFENLRYICQLVKVDPILEDNNFFGNNIVLRHYGFL